MHGKRTGFFISLLGLLFVANPAASAEYYVAMPQNGGSNSNDGSADHPWATVQYAADRAIAGDTINVRPGTYVEQVRHNSSGSDGKPITFQAEGRAEVRGFKVAASHIIVKGFHAKDIPGCDWDDSYGIYVKGSHNLIEDNFASNNCRGGIAIEADAGNFSGCSNNEIRNNKAFNNGMVGILVAGNNNRVESNEIWGTVQLHDNFIPGAPGMPSGMDADGIRFFGRGNTIRRNYIHDINYTDPKNYDPHIDCWQTWKFGSVVTTDTVIEQEICDVVGDQDLSIAFGPGEGMKGLQVEDAANITLRNNFIRAWKGAVVVGTNGVHIYNNHFISDQHWNVGYTGYSNDSNVRIANNLFYEIYGLPITSIGSSLTHDHNCYYRSDGQSMNFSNMHPAGSTDIVDQNPLLADPANGNYRLREGSPCIDAGTTLSAVTNDIDGNPRPGNGIYDIGAYEYSTSQPDIIAPQKPGNLLVE